MTYFQQQLFRNILRLPLSDLFMEMQYRFI